MNKRLRMLFLRTGNSSRSQMAEGWVNHLKNDVIQARPAGIETHGLNPLAVRAVAEAGVNITHHRSKLARDFMGEQGDFVVKVCGHAKETCPYFPGGYKKLFTWGSMIRRCWPKTNHPRKRPWPITAVCARTSVPFSNPCLKRCKNISDQERTRQ